MRIIKPITILLFSFLIVFNSFSQQSSVFNYLPPDAKMIIKVNPASLGQKIKWEEVLTYKIFEAPVKELPQAGKEFLENPSLTGIDLKQGFFIVSFPNVNKEKSDPVFYGTPADTAKIAAMVKKMFPGKKPIKTNNGKLIVDKHTAFAWNNEVVILTGDDTKKDSLTKPPTASAELLSMNQLTDRCKMLLSKHNPSLGNNDFSSLHDEQGDVLMWINTSLPSGMQTKKKLPGVFEMLNKNFSQKGNFVSCVMNFENGKIAFQMKQYVSESLDSFYEKYPLANINTELLKKLPADHPILLFTFSFSPEMLTSLFAKTGADKLIDSASDHKINLNEMFSAIKGDVTLAIMKADEVGEEDSVTQAMGGVELFIAGNINDKEKFKTINDLFQNKNTDPSKTNPRTTKPVMLSNDSIFVFCFSKTAGQKFLGSPGNNEEIKKLFDPYKNNSSVAIVDLRTILGFAMQTVAKGKSEEEIKHTAEVLGMFDKMIVFGSMHDNHTILTNMELTLTDKNENSLKQFFNLINLFYSMKPKTSTTYNERHE